MVNRDPPGLGRDLCTVVLKILSELHIYECGESYSSVTFINVQICAIVYKTPSASPQQCVLLKPLGMQSQKRSSVVSDPNMNPAHLCHTRKCTQSGESKILRTTNCREIKKKVFTGKETTCEINLDD